MRNQKDHKSTYIDVFVSFSSVVEHWLKRVIIVLLVTLVFFQMLLQFAEIRYYLTTIDRLEGMVEEPEYRE